MPDIICPPPYMLTIHGILNIVEMVFSILTFALSFGGGYYWNEFGGGGWVEFVGILSLILIFVFFMMHVILSTMPAFVTNYHIELIVYIALSIMFMIAGIVAAATWWANNSVKAASFFAFATMATLFVDIAFRIFRNMQGRSSPSHTGETHAQPPTSTVPPEYTSSNAVY